MKTIRSLLARYRLLTSVLSLAVMLGALYSSPVAMAAMDCELMGCVDWNAQTGCTVYSYCCVDFSSGSYACWNIGNGKTVRVFE